MKIQSLGHVVIKVRDQKVSEDFYNGVLGLPIVARYDELNMTFFSLGNHHDFAIAAVGKDAEDAPAKAPGLAHVAFKIGDSLDELREARDYLEGQGLELRLVDHDVSQSIYMRDPDGNMVEVYVDGIDDWKEDPTLVAEARELSL